LGKAAHNSTSDRFILDVSDGFDLTPWIEGLASFDLSVLSDAPGVDTDRRIVRLAFFAELAWKFTLHFLAWDEKLALKRTPHKDQNYLLVPTKPAQTRTSL
jgi:hypothetical protein